MDTQLINPDQIKASVREHYGQAIQRGSCCGGSSGCGCDEPTEVALYGTETLAELPQGVVTTSFGCGNPLALATLQPGEVVLDLGSGGGLDVLLAARRVGAQGYVYGLDMTDEMLAVARRNAERAGAQNVEFLKGDIESIPLPSASVDVIISNCVVNLAPDKGQVLSDAFRVLRPGGRLAISDIVIDGTLDGLPLDEAQIRAGLSWAGCIAGALTADQYRTLLAEAGFTDIRVEVVQRYRPDDLLDGAPAELATLSPEAQADLVGRFTSCAISARRPAA
ncbi:MAG: arsenite methyltransferase [Roseiflexaceae bacterium]